MKKLFKLKNALCGILVFILLCSPAYSSQKNYPEEMSLEANSFKGFLRSDGSLIPRHDTQYYELTGYDEVENVNIAFRDLKLTLSLEGRVKSYSNRRAQSEHEVRLDWGETPFFLRESKILEIPIYELSKPDTHDFKSKVEQFQLYDNHLYYIKNNALCAYDLSSNSEKALFNPKSKIRNYVVYYNQLFYVSDALYQYDMRTETYTKISPIMPYTMQIYNGVLYSLQMTGADTYRLMYKDLHLSQGKWVKGPSIKGRVDSKYQALYLTKDKNLLIYTQDAFYVFAKNQKKILKEVYFHQPKSSLHTKHQYAFFENEAYFIQNEEMYHLDLKTKKITPTKESNVTSLLSSEKVLWGTDTHGNLWKKNPSFTEKKQLVIKDLLKKQVLHMVKDGYVFSYEPLVAGKNNDFLSLRPLNERLAIRNHVQLSGSGHKAFCYEGRFYVSQGSWILSSDSNGGDSAFFDYLGEMEQITDLAIYGDFLYVAGNGLFKISLKDGSFEKIINKQVYHFEIDGDFILYELPFYKNVMKVFKIKLDGTEEKELTLPLAPQRNYLVRARGVYVIEETNNQCTLVAW